ncbi:fimbrial protein, partial [Escherichia coli]
MKYNNVIFLGLCLGLTTYSALSADSVIKISGRVLDYGCTVSSDSLNFTVDLQKNSARQFPTTGSTSPAVPFQITLSECSKGTTGGRVLMNPLMILVKIIKLRWIHILSYDQMVSRKINNQ